MSLNPTAVVGGGISSTITVYNGGAFEAPIVILDVDGTPLDITGATVTLEVYNARVRSETPTKSLPVTTTAGASGHGTLTVTGAEMDLPTGTKYAWVKVVDAGAEVYICDGMVTIQVG